MDVRIRQARPEDASLIADIAEKLRLPSQPAPSSSDRGFLMASSPETYSYFVTNDDVLVLEDRGAVVGFSIVIGPDTILRSGLWEKTKEIRWDPGYRQPLELATSAIYEQIALDPQYRRRLFATHLAFLSVERALSRYLRVFTSIARFPVQNRASLPFVERTGWHRVGDTDDEYPGHGRIQYDIYCLERSLFEAKLREPELASLSRRVRGCLG